MTAAPLRWIVKAVPERREFVDYRKAWATRQQILLAKQNGVPLL